MALHDISKGQTRKNPLPNTNDSQNNRMAHNTLSTTYRDEDAVSEQRVVFKNSLILTYDNDNKISSVYGYIPEVSDVPVFIIARDGYDVFEDILGVAAPTV